MEEMFYVEFIMEEIFFVGVYNRVNIFLVFVMEEIFFVG